MKILGIIAILALGSVALLNPGILPDHPLYKLNVLRDKVMLRFIVNPVKKIEYYLILSDTGIAESIALAKKGKSALAHQTALKAEHYYTQLVSDYKWAVWYHRDIPKALTTKIFQASAKHQEVLSELGFSDAEDFSKRNEQTLREFIEMEIEESLK